MINGKSQEQYNSGMGDRNETVRRKELLLLSTKPAIHCSIPASRNGQSRN
jgi:hypothetical protein